MSSYIAPEESLDLSGLPQEILNTILETKLERRYKVASIEQAKSAQQRVFILKLKPSNDKIEHDDLVGEWKDCLERGRNRLVVREWKGGCQWWNLHRNLDVNHLSHYEMLGYKVARQAFQRDKTSSTPVTIPRILFCHPSFSWAVMEYVGPNSTIFDESLCYDSYYLENMIKCRQEFGFEEPHPRWGRVPVNESLAYATLILDQVMIPLHQKSCDILLHETGHKIDHEYKTYNSMLQLYQEAWKSMSLSLSSSSSTNNGPILKDPRMTEALKLVKDAVVTTLPSNESSIPPLSQVLVHMDLQPQNLLFGKSKNNKALTVSSVLDWEDAALADPRFDLLLLCRKVCANRSQANAIWDIYNKSTTFVTDIGSIRPWLQLETIHSIITMLLQSMDLLNGGRNPWETKTDLWEKLQREFHRWKELLKELND